MDLWGKGKHLKSIRTKQRILKNEEALQPVLAWCFPPPPCTWLVESLPCWAGSTQLLHLQGNALTEVRSKCCAATRQPCKKSGLPACMETSSKQLEPKVHMNISSLAWIALAIYKVKQSLPPPCDGKGTTGRQHDSATRVNTKRGALWESLLHRGSSCI